MGRKGMKGFMKSAMARKPGEAEDAAEEGGGGSDHEQQQQPSSPPPKKAPPPTTAAAAPAAAPAGSDNDDDDEDHASGPETRGHMVQRHKREIVAFKRASQRGKSKAEAAKALADLEARHAKELAEFDKAAAGGGGGAGAGAGASAAAATAGDRASKYLAGVSLENGAEEQHNTKGPSKAQKRRDKLAAREAERDARIAAELAALGPTERAKEAAALRELLAPLGLAVKSIRADGHCLYHSVADQLKQQQEGEAADAAPAAPAPPLPDYLGLRRLAAAHMRAHRADFEPFVLAGDHGEAEAVPRGWDGDNQGENEGQGGGNEEEDEDKKNKDAFSRYVDAVEKTAAWGGHVELTALAAALKRRIRVVAVGMPEVTAGEEEEGEPLTVCYVRHEFGLGEHYNSVRPKGEEEEGGEEGAAAQEGQQEEEE
jgi:OTU domain-containing protein 6